MDYPIRNEDTRGIESPSGDRMQGAPGLPRGGAPDTDRAEADSARRSSPGANGAEAGDMHAAPDPSAAGPRESMPEDKAASTTANEDDATYGDQDIDTAGTAHDDLSPTKSM